MVEFNKIVASVKDGVGVIQMNDPSKKNALGWELHYEIIAAMEAWAEDDEVSVVLFQGTEDYFCSGWALDVLQDTQAKTRTKFVDLALKLMTTVYDYRKPTIAAVAGVAPGYGMDLANMCDITIASANAAFGSTQVKYAMNGFYHGLMRKVGVQKARQLFFTGDPISADEAYRIGLVAQVVPAGTVRESALKLAQHIAEHGAELTVVLKEVALRASNMDHIGATAYELRVTADLVQRELFTKQIKDGITRMKAKKSKAIERL